MTTNWGPNGQDIYERTYSRPKADGSKETWPETVDRVVRGNLALVPEEFHRPGELEELTELMLDMKVLPAGRHLWVTGVEGRQHNRNCHRAGWGPTLADHHAFTFSELLKGGGVGANYSSEYLETLPEISNTPTLVIVSDAAHPDFAEYEHLANGPLDSRQATYFSVPDTREGWVEAVEVLINSFTDPEVGQLLIDVSDVRPRGAELKTMGGTASGPGPLVDALVTIYGIFRNASANAPRLTPLEAMSVDHALAGAVVAGGVRRSARMSILHWQDEHIFEFINCKAGHKDHWSTNISVEVGASFFAALEAGDSHATAVFNSVTRGMLLNGEPGFYHSDLASVGEEGDVRATNPCGEIALEPWEACNLGHVNLAAFPNAGDPAIERAFRLMTRFLIRATFADLTDPRQVEIEGRNRRIGVGIFGAQEWAIERGVKYSDIHKSTDLAEELRWYRGSVNFEAVAYASELGIPTPVKTTTVAPTGTIAKLPGTSEGIHPLYARFFERRIRYSSDDPALIELEARGLEIEDCIYSPNTKVVVHHVKDPMVERYGSFMVEQSNEISPWDLAATQAFFQKHYANNAVSFTMNVSDEMHVDNLRAVLRRYMPSLKGTTVMVDSTRPQSPYTRLTEAQYLAAADHEVGQGEMDCSSGACPIR